jgi:hypothetical protein
MRKAIGLHTIKEYVPGELTLYKQGQQLKYSQPDISKFNALDFKTYLIYMMN